MTPSISACLAPILTAHFGVSSMRLTPEQNPLVVFPAKHPEVGDIEVYDEGDELTIFLGHFSHAHLGNYDEGISDAQRVERIAAACVELLLDVFADRIEFYGNNKSGGGYRLRSAQPRGVLSRLFLGKRTYVWSGPLQNDDQSFN